VGRGQIIIIIIIIIKQVRLKCRKIQRTARTLYNKNKNIYIKVKNKERKGREGEKGKMVGDGNKGRVGKERGWE